MEYRQLGGFDAALYSYGRDLGRKVYEPLRWYLRSRDEGLELVLGIKRSGTSHILLTRDEKQHLTSARIRDLLQPRREIRAYASDFESLSPIFFRGFQELEAKLEGLKPKPKSTSDTSTLNKGYGHGGQHGVVRAQFENSRVFYRVLQNKIDRHRFDLGDASGVASMRVYSFCYNLWLLDARSLDDRRRSPRILDLGWCEAPTPTLEGEMNMSQHAVFKNNQFLKNPEKVQKSKDDNDDPPVERARYEYSDPHGETLICDPLDAAQKVRAFFEKNAQSRSQPVVLLVHDAESALDVFKSLGVDASQWDFELKNLLRERNHRPRQAANDPRPSRRRSASPRPHDRSRRRDSPPPARQYSPVYVVDVKAMFTAVLGTADHSDSVPAIAKRLGLFEPVGWCAGNECWMLIEIFRQMAMRGAIDEQRKEWPDLRVQADAANLRADEEQSEYVGSDSDD
ncbi:hypothetical protein DFH06DRAFT_481640 [Mycena polygramma]|nr:hypothetical protein DFH06DRAFT_481640 [Mycena polygramma]